MTDGEVKNEALKLLDKYSGTEDTDCLARIPGLVNDALLYLATGAKRLPAQVPNDCRQGFSNSRTCEMGLSQHAGIPYHSILYLVGVRDRDTLS